MVLEHFSLITMGEATNSHQIICRTCSNFHNNLFNIYDEDTSDQTISEKLMECTDIKVQKDDGLSAKICDDCLKTLNLAYNFKQMVVEIDKWLRNHHMQQTESKLTKLNELSNEKLTIKEEDHFCDNTEKNTTVEEEEAPLSVTENSDNLESHINCITQSNQTIGVIESNSNISNTDSLPSHLNIPSSLGSIKQIEESNFEENQYLTNQAAIDEEGDEDMDSPIESLNISEYDKLKKTLNTAEKRKTKLYCKDCKKSYNFDYYFRVHIALHTGLLPHKCETCGKAFATADILRQHLNRTHNNDKSYECEVCGKIFKSQVGLQLHMPVHTGERPYKCHLCEKAFAYSGSLKYHIHIHTSERPFVCEICGKSFPAKSNLTHHYVTHNSGEEYKYVCTTCGKSFTKKRSLAAHQRTHVKRHKCNYCDKTFASTGQLTNHIPVHTGERQHPCKVCGKLFKNRCTIYRHMRVHTGETPFPCELCPEKFKYSHHLKNHVKIRHK